MKKESLHKDRDIFNNFMKIMSRLTVTRKSLRKIYLTTRRLLKKRVPTLYSKLWSLIERT